MESENSGSGSIWYTGSSSGTGSVLGWCTGKGDGSGYGDAHGFFDGSGQGSGLGDGSGWTSGIGAGHACGSGSINGRDEIVRLKRHRG